MRIGHGYDSHRFGADRPLVLGGVQIPDAPGLIGHSDADPVAHAVIDAMLGAAGLGDVGTHFPPSDPRWENADSMALLAIIVEHLTGENYQVVNIDTTIITESPRIRPHAEAMRQRLAEVVGIRPSHVSVKGKSNEGMGWIGTGEGIAVHAVVLIDRIEDQDLVHARHSPELPPL